MALVLRAPTTLNALRKVGLAALLLFVISSGAGQPPARRRAAAFQTFPRTTVWAWENPEDLRALDPRHCAVAYLDQTVLISREVSIRPRRQGLLVSPETRIMAVVRIQTAGEDTVIDSPNLPSTVATIIEHSAEKAGVSALQIDFDATRRQRVFYSKLLGEVRRSLPKGMPLSITALASWCAGDDWIDRLPVDEAVPMFFRMGRDRRPSNEPGWSYPIREPLCKTSAGVSTDEPWPALRPDQRVYVFHPRAWTTIALGNVDVMVQQ